MISANDGEFAELQKQMVNNSSDNAMIKELGRQINDLWGGRQKIHAEVEERTDLLRRINAMVAFLGEMPVADIISGEQRISGQKSG